MSGSSNHHTNDAHSPTDRGLASSTSERVLQCVLGSVLFERFCFFLLISVLVLYLNERRGYSAPHAVQLVVNVAALATPSTSGGRHAALF